jgi:hypothetical protein
MQPDAQRRILVGKGHGFLTSWFVHHQAGGGQNPFPMGADDGLVDGTRTAEVVCVYDKAARL